MLPVVHSVPSYVGIIQIRFTGRSWITSSQPAAQAPRVIQFANKKTGDTPLDAPCKKSGNMTSYGGIIRIRCKGRSLVTSSQPASQAPLYLVECIVRRLSGKCKT